MSDRICQDEPGHDASKLSRWFASRIDSKRAVREALREMCRRQSEIARAAIKAEQERYDAIWRRE